MPGANCAGRAAASTATAPAASEAARGQAEVSSSSLDQRRQTLGGWRRRRLDIGRERDRLNDAAVLLDGQQLLVVQVAAVIAERASRRVRGDHRRLRQRDRLHVRRLRRVREVDHDADAIQLGDDLLAESLRPLCSHSPSGFAGVRVGELAVAVVRQRQVAGAAIVELLDARDRGRLVAQRSSRSRRR